MSDSAVAMASPRPNRPIRRITVHGFRIALLVAIIVMIHWQHRQFTTARQAAGSKLELSAEQLERIYGQPAELGAVRSGGARIVENREGDRIGDVIQTSPESDHIIGFSGPTNVLIAFDEASKVQAVEILSSGDTRDHIREVIEDERFLAEFIGRERQQLKHAADIDTVSGATLTSLAILQSIQHRLGGDVAVSLKFPEPPAAEQVRRIFDFEFEMHADENLPGVWRLIQGEEDVGSLIDSSLHSDDIIGYQGPTRVLIGLDQTSQVRGIVVAESFDNEPYTDYVREDEYFREWFSEQDAPTLAAIDLEQEYVDGVSGATMTSEAVVASVIKAIREVERRKTEIAQQPIVEEKPPITSSDVGTLFVVVAAFVIGLTSLRGTTWVRIPFQLLLIGYLGLVNGDLLSQAMLVGWSRHGVPWSSAIGLVALSIAAFSVPIFTKQNLYCSHLCPHGAVQQLVRNRLPWKLKPGRRTTKLLDAIPGLLLIWVIVVAMTGWGFSLVDIEPFDAYLFQIAGWATTTIAIVGIIASLFVPMAYCRFGCPTGALLNYIRFNARSDELGLRDAVAGLCLGIAIVLFRIG